MKPTLATLTPEQKKLIADFLRVYFPALETDEPMSGADAIDHLCFLFAELTKEN